MNTARTSSTSGVIDQPNEQRRNRRRVAVMAAAAATLAGLGGGLTRAATTHTWVGNFIDPSSGTGGPNGGGVPGSYTPNPAVPAVTGLDPYRWTLDANNWTNGTYAQGDDVVFTDNFTGGTAVRLTGSSTSPTMLPRTMTFTHIAGSTPTNYVFLAGGDFTFGTSNTSLGSTTPFGTANTFGSQLILDTGFLGKVQLRVGSTQVTSGTPNVIVRSGVLQLDNAAAMPTNTSNANKPNIELAGGQLWLNVNPSSTQDAGTMTVSDNSIVANATTGTDVRLWNGVLNISAGKTLTVESLNYDTTISSTNQYNVRMQATFSGALNQGTFQLADVGGHVTKFQFDGSAANSSLTNATMDLGSGQSQLYFGVTGTWNAGALKSSGTPFIRGNGSTTAALTLSVGALNLSTTYTGGIVEAFNALGTPTTNFTKTGNGTLTLTNLGDAAVNGTFNSYAGATTISAGSIVLTNNATIASSSALSMGLASSLVLDNTTTNNSNRLSDTATVTMGGGTLQFNANAGGTNEVAGPLALGSGQNHINTTGTGSLTFASLTRNSGGGAVDFAPGGSAAINFTAAPPTFAGIIGGFATINGTNWATVTGGGNTVTAFGGYTNAGNGADPSTWTTSDNINVTATSGLTVATSPNINSLRLAGVGGNLTINSGQILAVGANGASNGGVLATVNATIAGPGALTAGTSGTQELILNVAGANVLNVSAPIANNAGGGTVSVTKAGSGKLVLGPGNSYTGATNLLEGTLQAGAANLFSGNLTINNNTTFDIGGFNQNIGTLNIINGALTNSGSPAATVTGTAYTVQQGTLGATLAGTAPLVKSSNGTVLVTAAQSYGGTTATNTSITNGTLQLGLSNALPTSLPLSITGGGSLDLQGFNQTTGALTLGLSASASASAGNIVGTGVISPSSMDLEQGTVSAIIGGSAQLQKNGQVDNHTVTLSNHNTYTGGTIVNAGALAMGIDDALPVGSNVSLVNAGSGINSRLELNSFTQHLGTLTMDVASATDTALRSSTGGGTVFANTFDFRNGRVVSAVTLAGTASLVKTTGGSVRISGSMNTYTGNTIVSDGGFLQTDGGDQSLGASGNQLIISDNSTLVVAGDIVSPNRNVTIGSGGASFNTVGGAGPGNGDATFGTVSGSGQLNKNGTATMTVANIRIGSANPVNVNGGKLAIAPSGGALSGVSRIGSLAANALFDITDNKVITTSPVGTASGGFYDGVSGMIQSGRNGGGWTGTFGVVTSQSNATGGNFTSIGVATAQQVKGLANPTDTAVFAGQTVTGSDTLVMYTYGGDANLDGKINVDDYGKIDFNVNLGTSGWINGDFNYDGKINVDDYGIIDFNVGIQGAPFPTAGALSSSSSLSGVSAVPEPATLSLLAVGAAGLLGRRRRSRGR